MRGPLCVLAAFAGGILFMATYPHSGSPGGLVLAFVAFYISMRGEQR